jgi:hypothetical protein
MKECYVPSAAAQLGGSTQDSTQEQGRMEADHITAFSNFDVEIKSGR